jgi:hypothetical protein
MVSHYMHRIPPCETAEETPFYTFLIGSLSNKKTKLIQTCDTYAHGGHENKSSHHDDLACLTHRKEAELIKSALLSHAD